jgi:hypothetical protein
MTKPQKTRSLRIQLPLELASGAKAKVSRPFEFSIRLVGHNLKQCLVSVQADPSVLLASAEQITVDLARTDEIEVWVSVLAQSDALIQAAGFFVSVR